MSEQKINFITLLILIVLFGPIIFFGLKTLIEDCPSDKIMVRGVMGWECVAR